MMMNVHQRDVTDSFSGTRFATIFIYPLIYSVAFDVFLWVFISQIDQVKSHQTTFTWEKVRKPVDAAGWKMQKSNNRRMTVRAFRIADFSRKVPM